jgi:glycolate oxidase subunit GlcD
MPAASAPRPLPPSKALLRDLRRVLGEPGLLLDPTKLLAYESDGLCLVAEHASLVVLPRTTEQASQALRLLFEAGLPVVPRGAGTGLTGGASPVAGGAVLSLARMRDILFIDADDRYARVQAGVVNVDLSAAVKPHGLYYAPDPSSQQACTLGGNLANNSGGPHCFKHGNTARHLLGALWLEPDGTPVDLSSPVLDPEGLDLLGFLVGSEGTLGVATELTLNLLPLPEKVETLLGIYRHLDEACQAVSDLIRAGLEPAAIEILDRLTIEAVEASVFRAGYPRDAGAVLLIECEGRSAEVEALCSALEALMRQRGAFELRRANSAAERKQLWAGRKGAFGAMGRIAPDLYVADAVVPRTRLAELVAYASAVCAERRLKLANVFHAGDGNLHPNICYDRRDPDEVRRVLEAGDLILNKCVEFGGSLSGEHGIGLEKREHMCSAFKQADLDAMAAVRRAYDPAGRMNPGKLLPTRACLELRTAPPVPWKHPAGEAPL